MSSADEQYKKKLIERYVAGEASEKELQAFFGLLTEAEIDSLIEEHMDQEILRLREEQHLLTPVKRYKVWKYAAVVSGLLLISISGYYILNGNKQRQKITQNQTHDIAPGHNQATLTLSNGQKIVIYKGLNGKLAQQGNSLVQVNGGSAIIYTANDSKEQAITYNTLSTARGEQSPYPLVLADGTKVWLNAASSITFPTAFSRKERNVTITGEAYITVAHNALQPFKVKVRDQIIEDIGTEFNINAYNDEPVLKTTLITGSVKISAAQNSLVLKPGEQAQNSNHVLKVQRVDTDGIIAWKNNYFSFDDNNLESIMRQVSRWYNVDVVYKNESTKAKMITGTISRYKNVSSILRKLEITGAAHFRIDGKQIIVTE